MSTSLQAFSSYLRTHVDARLDSLVVQVQSASPAYRQLEPATLRASFQQTLRLIVEVLASESHTPNASVIERLTQLGANRAQEGFAIEDLLISIMLMRALIWDLLENTIATGAVWQPHDARTLEDLMHQLSNTLMVGYSQTYQQVQQEVRDQANELEAQRSTIRELGTPILPLHEGVLVLPLVGSIDSHRASQVMERLLEAISAQQADIVLIDITGVPVVDTGVANYLLQTAQAAQLVGAQVVLVGIGAEIAQTIVQLGVDLSRLKVYANLQTGIRYALSQVGA